MIFVIWCVANLLAGISMFLCNLGVMLRWVGSWDVFTRYPAVAAFS